MPTSPLGPGDPGTLGGYQLTSRLGRGGMGTVYLGRDDAGRKVAVKVINPELAGHAAFAARFRREVTAARQVRRFSTAAVLDARLEGSPLYVVTEFVDGPTLHEHIRQKGPMRGGELEALAVNIATALSAIHAAGVVHRDLKPANVMLSSTGPRVIDFGIARALDAVDGLTFPGQFIGTPAYLAPELMRGGKVTPAVDVFSWGCVVAYAGSGRPPFGRGTLPEIMHRVVNEPPFLDGLEPELHALVEQALDKDPARRPDTAKLIRRLTGHHETVVPASTPRNRRGLWIGTSALVGTLASAFLLSQVVSPRGDGPPGSGTTVVKDDFANASTGWPNGPGCAGYKDDVFLLDLPAASGRAACTASKPVTGNTKRSLVDVRVRLATGPRNGRWEAGIHFLKAADRYDVVLRRDGTAHLVKTIANRRVQLAKGRVGDFKPNGFNRVQAELDQSLISQPRFVLWVNGAKVFEHIDTKRPLRQGTTGLVLYNAGVNDRVTATFDDFTLSRLG